jgi:hypothetical protein
MTIKNHIKPFIGQLKLTDLNGIVLQEFFNEKYKSGRLDHKGGLSEKTVLNIRQMLHAALRKALENGFIPANYVEHVRLQKVSIPDMRVLTVEEQHRFVSTLVTNSSSGPAVPVKPWRKQSPGAGISSWNSMPSMTTSRRSSNCMEPIPGRSPATSISMTSLYYPLC